MAPAPPSTAVARLLAVLLLAAAGAQVADAQTPKDLLEAYYVTRTVGLADIPNCVPDEVGGGPASDVLRGGITGDCILQGIVAPDETILVQFEVVANDTDPNSAAPGTWDLMAQIRAIGGGVNLSLLTPSDNDPPSVDYAEDVMYSARENSEKYIGLSGEFLAKNPGSYLLNITGLSDNPTYFSLQLHTPLATIRLIEEEVAVMRDLHQRCCPPGSTSQFCTKILPAVIAPTRPPGADICRMPPTHCGPTGRLRQLILAGAGLNCGDLGLPPTFSQLAELTTLDLAYNKIGGTTDELGTTLGGLPSLRRLFMRYTNLTGGLECPIVAKPSLTTVSLSGNMGITGPIPDCYLTDPTLQELYLSFTGIDGIIPDVIPPGSPLRIFYAISRLGDDRAPTGAGLSGPIPTSFAGAPQLTFVDLSNNQFDGAIPTLPASLKYFNVSANMLTSMPATFPPGAEVFDASYNAISGLVPPVSQRLIHLNLAENDLGGGMPAIEGEDTTPPGPVQPPPPGGRKMLWSQRLTIDATRPNPAIEIPNPDDTNAPRLRFVDLKLNHLTGSLPAEWVQKPYSLHTMDLASNDLGGSLPPDWRLDQLAWLDLSGNMLEGPLPESLGSLPSLVHVDLSNNALSGDLAAFAKGVASGSGRLVYLDLATNYFTGPVPDDFGQSVVLDSNAQVFLDGEPAERKLDLSNNSFSGGPFPMWLVSQLFQELDACGAKCRISVKVNGDDDHLACPTKAEAEPFRVLLEGPKAKSILTQYNFQCDAGDGTQVPLLSVLDGSKAGSRERMEGKGPAPTSEQLAAIEGRQVGPPGGVPARPQKKLAGGAIAGIVIGSVAGVALLAGAAWFVLSKTRARRAGYAKETLNGAGGVGRPGSGGGSGRRSRSSGGAVGAGWGNRVAARDAQRNGAFGELPPAREI